MLYTLCKSFIPFPLLGYLLNGIYYGLILAGIAWAGLLIHRTMLRLEYPAVKTRIFVIGLCLIAFPAGVISSRAANMFYFPAEQWSLYFFVDQFVNGDNQTFHAGLVLPFLLISLLMIKMKIDFGQGWDVVFLHVPLAHALGRLGCFLVGCCGGREVSFYLWGASWSFENPVPLYAVLWNITLYWILHKQFLRVYAFPDTRPAPKGTVLAAYLILYGLGRMLLELLRKEKIIALGLTQAQIAMMGFILAGSLLMVIINWKKHAVES